MELTDTNFDQEVYESSLPVMVEFWGSWCPPCKMMAPLIDRLADEYKGVIKICKINIDRNRRVSRAFRLKGVPAFCFFQDGNLLRQEVGAKSATQLRTIIADIIG